MKTWIVFACVLSVMVCRAEQAAVSGDQSQSGRSQEVLSALDRIVVAKIEFKEACIGDVVTALNKAAIANDPQKKGVNIVLAPSGEEACTNSAGQFRAPSVTLMLKNVSLRTVLKVVAEETGVKCRVQNSIVKYMGKDEPETELVTRAYSVERSFIERIRENVGGTSTNSTKMPNEVLKKYFESMGMEWPRGSQLTYAEAANKLVVKTDEVNIHICDCLLMELDGCSPLQVQIQTQFVRFDATNITCAGLAGGRNDLIMKLWTNGCGRLVAAPTTITRSGAECSVKCVSEIIYPTSFTADTNMHYPYLGGMVLPSDFATREVGSIVNILPEISPSGDIVNLTLKPQIVECSGWKDYGRKMLVGTNESVFVPMEQPIFHVYQCETQLSVKDGETAIAFGGVPSMDGKTFLYCFLTIRLLVEADPRPIRRQSLGWRDCEGSIRL